MKTAQRLIVAGLALLALLPQPLRTAPACESVRSRTVRVPLPRGVNVPEARVRILLPDGYECASRRYPVVYVFHGVGDNYRTWTELTDIARFSRRFPAIFVMPDAGSGSEAGWYSDWKDGSRQWETFHTKVLVRYVDRTLRTLGARHRGVVGTSMGGFGAMSYAARHRGLFRAAASFSGVVDTMYAAPLSGVVFHLGGQGVAGQSVGTPTENVWGSQISEEETWRAHNPTDRAADLKGVWLYVSTGTGAPGGEEGEDPSRPHGYATENFVWQMNMNFMGALDEAGVAYTSDVHGGYHHWPYWQRDMHQALPKLLAAISR